MLKSRTMFGMEFSFLTTIAMMRVYIKRIVVKVYTLCQIARSLSLPH